MCFTLWAENIKGYANEHFLIPASTHLALLTFANWCLMRPRGFPVVRAVDTFWRQTSGVVVAIITVVAYAVAHSILAVVWPVVTIARTMRWVTVVGCSKHYLKCSDCNQQKSQQGLRHWVCGCRLEKSFADLEVSSSCWVWCSRADLLCFICFALPWVW